MVIAAFVIVNDQAAFADAQSTVSSESAVLDTNHRRWHHLITAIVGVIVALDLTLVISCSIHTGT